MKTILIILTHLILLTGCQEKKEKKKQPGNFFSSMGALLSGKATEIHNQAEKDIQTYLDQHYPQYGLKLISAHSNASLASGMWDIYGFAAVDPQGMKIMSSWNNYTEAIAVEDFSADYEKARLHKTYADTLLSKLPPHIPAKAYYRTKGYNYPPDEYMRFYIFCEDTLLQTNNKKKLIDDIRSAVKQTLTVYEKTNYEVSLSFTAHDAPRDPHAWDDALDEITRTYLVVELRPENEKEMPNLTLGGGIAREWHTNIQQQLLGEETYVTSPYFLIRQDDLSELYTIIPVTWENDSTTYVYGTFTTQLQLKEKNKITLPRSTGYKYKDLEYLIPRQFRYPQVPKETLRSPIVPFYNPYYNPY